MTKPAYYNEIDPFAAAWLRELIKADLIASGDVDERSITDVRADDLRGYTQCHFFAGIGVWSYVLRGAGWRDDEPVWTGSCPCQGFSVAGKGGGFDDPRHLWPQWIRLIRECKPDTIFGEQVEAAIRFGWLDLIQDDLEREGYAIGSVVWPAAGVGAPHIRSRLYFVADAERRGCGAVRATDSGKPMGDGNKAENFGPATSDGGIAGVMAHSERKRGDWPRDSRERRERLADDGATGELGNAHGTECPACSRFGQHCGEGLCQQEADGLAGPGGIGGWWGNAEWLYCRDEKYRPVEPGTFPLAHGAPARVGRLRGYGNCIVAPQAEAFIRAYREICSS